eukprot:CAMPEP_0204643684 /NCGR_PEP_ID=MMETSP0718-20130828/897_1 /ASSEMBLY_ACC=CAM_ASM_000674 /TAXON_ID=230516 /ORGANISM="Chaetoceros curvisetus" /LENGTH=299 /DNA_ID=CAMNT_0051664987 /DNA_START=1498 /DNA_END=2397 /DNA_ORIENTATION=-
MKFDSTVTTAAMENIEDSIFALLERELKYVTKPHFSRKVSSRNSPVSVLKYRQNDASAFTFDNESRLLILQWMYEVVDHYSVSREIIPIAMSFFDRYVAKNPIGCYEREQYQLLALTSLYTAIKLHENNRAGSLDFFSKLSSKRFSPREIEAMEKKLLNDLDWLMNPPTPQSFVSNFMDLLTATISDEEVRCALSNIYEVTNYVVEVALLRSSVQYENASTLAFASLIVAMRDAKTSVIPQELYKSVLSNILSFDFASPDEIAIVADEVKSSLESGDMHLNMNDVYKKFDPEGSIYQLY